MSTRNLAFLLAPRSVAIIGASDRPQSVGATITQNLLKGSFDGTIALVNSRHDRIAGRPAFRSVTDLPETPELAVICTPAPTVPAIIEELGARGAKAAIVIGSGFDTCAPSGKSLKDEMLAAAKPYRLRVLGANCIGLLSPRIGLNASFAHTDALPGHLAFVAQSGALTTALLDWARSLRIGFSHFVSMGNAADVDVADLLDYLAADRETRAILLYIESLANARKFMSAARAAARIKPVVVVKSGRAEESARAALSHTGALAGADEVYDAAFRRAGMLRVATTRELFDAAETLATLGIPMGDRLALVSNGGGPLIMATDALIESGGVLAQISSRTIETLDAHLPKTWSRANPVDIGGDAPAERYACAIEAALDDPNVDATLLIHAPTAIVSSAEIAAACIPVLKGARKPVLTCWMGGDAVRDARASCGSAGIPTYSTPEEAVGAFLHVVQYRRNQQLLMEVPPSVPDDFEVKAHEARQIIARVLADGRSVLTEPEAKDVLAAYGIPVVETRVAGSLEELPAAVAGLSWPVVLKILSPDISHKSDIGGVVLGLSSIEELHKAAGEMLKRCVERAPEARITGFTVQPMIRRPHAYELIAGIAVDATFGPIALFGQGGTAVEVIADKAVSLLPLNLKLAAELVSRTRISRLLAGFRDRAPVDRRALELVLVRLSQLAVDIAEITELDINPLLADEHGVIALDARIRIAPASGAAADRLAIRPYPTELEEAVTFAGRSTILRPIRPDDLPRHEAFIARCNPEDLRTRFFHSIEKLPFAQLARFTQLDYERDMAFIAVARNNLGVPETLGAARAHADADNIAAEFAVLVRSDVKGQGLGTMLLKKLILYGRGKGLKKLFGEVLAENTPMLRLAQSLGFHAGAIADGTITVTLDL
jgi:acetyltransferase